MHIENFGEREQTKIPDPGIPGVRDLLSTLQSHHQLGGCLHLGLGGISSHFSHKPGAERRGWVYCRVDRVGSTPKPPSPSEIMRGMESGRGGQSPDQILKG